jgi:tetraacyldisaccharide 4'-kinase
MNLQPATRNSQLATLLLPLGYLYGQAMRLRWKLYEFGLFKTRSLPCRVISIGNLTLGGTGKTPLTIWLTNYIRSKGKEVAIVSRGYRAKDKSPVSIVSDGEDILLGPDEAGDEPFMMASNLPGIPLLIGKKRFPVGMRAIEDFSPDVVLLDDGYQHLGLARDLNLLLLRTVKPFGNGHVFPAGTLREPLSALKRADAFILTYAGEKTGPVMEEQWLFLQERFPNKPVFVSYCKPSYFYLLNETHMSHGDEKDNKNRTRDSRDGCPTTNSDFIISRTGVSPVRRVFRDEKKVHPPSELMGRKALAFCGIAHPESFRKMLIRLGIDLLDFIAYHDHYDYHRGDLEKIEERAAGKGAEFIITTEKDAVKIETHIAHGIKDNGKNPPSPPFSKGGDTFSLPLEEDGNSSIPPFKKRVYQIIPPLGKRGYQLIPPLEKGDTGGFSDEKPIGLKIPIGVLKTEFIFESDFASFIDECMGI